MASQIGTVSIDLEARLAKFESDMGRTARIVEKEMEKSRRAAEQQARQMQRAVDGAASGIAKTLQTAFAGVTVAAITAFGKRLIDVGDEINDLSQKFGISVQALSVWRLSAEKSGTSLDGIAKGAKILSKDLGDTETKLASMGIQLRDTAGQVKPMETVMEEIAVKVSRYADGQEKAALMTALFGKAGADMIPFMNDLGKNLEENRRKAEAFGVMLGPDFTRASDEFNDNLRDMQAVTEGFGNAVLSKLLPVLNDLVGSELDVAEKHRGLQSAGEALGEHLAFLATTFGDLVKAVREALGALEDLNAEYPVLQKLSSVNKAVTGFFMSPGGTVRDGINAVLEMAGATQKLGASSMDTAKAQREWEKAGDDLLEQLVENHREISNGIPVLENNADKTKKSAAATKAAAEADRARKEEEAQLLRVMGEGLEAHKALIKTLGDYAKAQDDAREAIEKRHEEEDRALRLAAMDTDARRRAENAIAAMAAAMKNYTAAVAAGIPISEEQLANEIAITEAKLNDTNATEELTRVTEEFGRTMENITNGAIDDFLTAILSGEDAFKSLENAGKASLANISRMFRQTVLTQGGGGWDKFTQKLNSQSMYGPGGQGGSVGGWMGAAGLAYSGWQNAKQGGSALSTIGQYTAAGAMIGGIYGAAVGAVVGILVAAFTHGPKPPEIQAGGSGATIDRNEASVRGAFGLVNVNTVGSGQLKSTDVADAIAKFDEQIASFLNEDQIGAITQRLASWSIDLKKDAASVEGVLTDRFNAILSTFDSDIVGFVNGADKLEDRVQRLADAVTAAGTFDAIGLDVTFAQFLTLVDQMQKSGETTSATMQRLVGSTQLLGGALQVTGITLDKTGADFIKFAADISDAAGGLDQATALWDAYFSHFYSPEELARKTVDAATTAAFKEFADIGMDSLPSLAEFRRQFEAAMPTLSPEQIVQWLQAGAALGVLDDDLRKLAETTGITTDAIDEQIRKHQELNELLNGMIWDDYLEGLSDHDRQLALIHKHYQDLYDEAVRLGAGERELAVIREHERLAVDNLNESVTDLIETLDPRGSIYQIIDHAEDAANAMAAALQRIAQYLLGLRTNEQLSTLTPGQRLDEAQAQFDEMARQARLGNVDAANALPQYAQTLLEQARAFWASGPQYDAIFRAVEDQLQSVLNRFPSAQSDPFVRMATALETHLPSIDAHLAQIAASAAAQPSYDSGIDFVPYDQTARIHRGEAVLTASENAARKRGGSVTVSGDVAVLLRDLIQAVKEGNRDESQKLATIASGVSKLQPANRRG